MNTRALGLADLDEVLPRQLQRGLDRLGAAAHEVDVAEAGRRGPGQLIRERFGRLGGEEAGVRVGQRVDLRVHGREHVRVAVAQARDRGAAARVEILPAGGVGDEHPVAADGDRRRHVEVAMDDVGHSALPHTAATPRLLADADLIDCTSSRWLTRMPQMPSVVSAAFGVEPTTVPFTT